MGRKAHSLTLTVNCMDTFGPLKLFVELMGARRLTTGSTKSEPLTDGSEFTFGNKDVLIDCPLSRGEYLSGRCFGRNTAVFSAVEVMAKVPTSAKKFVPFKPVTVNTPKPNAPTHASSDLDLDGIDLTQSSKASSSEDKALESYWSVNW